MRHGRRKDLQDLRDLPRHPLPSYLQKQSEPAHPRSKLASSDPMAHPMLAAFASSRTLVWLWQYLSQRLGPRHRFLTYAASDADRGVYEMPGGAEEVRIALASDWGTGTDEAFEVATLIEDFTPDYTIHLGDIYYVGSAAEIDENFLGIKRSEYDPCLWPQGALGSFALNGNHEMYARGIAYFDRMLPRLGLRENGAARGQRASFFCLENEHWRIIALDTGYDSIDWPIIEYFRTPPCGLRPEQLAWIRDIVRPRADDARGIILLSHHQVCSRYDECYPLQARQLAAFFKRPVLWFWGHEHRMAVYEEFAVAGLRAFGRCIGHGGMPVDLPPAVPTHPECVVEFVDARPYPNDEGLTVGYNGFARLTLSGSRATVDYQDVDGTVVFTEMWKMDESGTLQRDALAGA